MKTLRRDKLFIQLAPSEQEKIKALYTKDVLDENNKYLAQVQKNMLMMQCIAMHRAGVPLEVIWLVLGNMKEVYYFNSKIKTEAEQMEWLRSQMDEIFGEGKYPYDYIDKLERME